MRRYGMVVLLLISLWSGCANAMRERYPLEAFELSSLKLVRIHRAGKCASFAFVRDPNGYVHRVFRGDYIGKNFGQVVELSEMGIRLREAFQTDGDEWVQKETWLRMTKER